MKESYNTYGEFQLWLSKRDWFFVKRILHNAGKNGTSSAFTEYYLTPEGRELTIFCNDGLMGYPLYPDKE